MARYLNQNKFTIITGVYLAFVMLYNCFGSVDSLPWVVGYQTLDNLTIAILAILACSYASNTLEMSFGYALAAYKLTLGLIIFTVGCVADDVPDLWRLCSSYTLELVCLSIAAISIWLTHLFNAKI